MNKPTSTFACNRQEFEDLALVSYRYIFTRYLVIYLAAAVVSLIFTLHIGILETNPTFIIFAVLLGALIIIKHNLEKSVGLNYDRFLLTAQCDDPKQTVTFDDKIILSNNFNSNERVYDYAQVKNIFESPNFILIEIDKRLFINVTKDIKDDIIPLLFERCTNIKKKKVIDLSNIKTKYNALTVLTAVSLFIYIAAAVVAIFLNIDFGEVL